MKTHGNLWSRFISEKNFALAAKRALRNKRKTGEIRRFIKDIPGNTEEIRQSVIRGEFKTAEYRKKTIYEPKKRDIHILPFYPDRVVHHALMNILIPIWDKMFVRDSYACRPGRGLHSASRRVMQFIRRNEYYLQCDVRKFYPNVNHEILYDIIARKIRDEKILGIIRNIIDSVDGEINLPIGNFCSQWFGNLYLHELDMFVKHDLHVRDYVRYCDDFCLFSDDKRKLNVWRDEIRRFLSDNLRLNFSYAEIAPVACGVDFCGYRHFPNRVFLRKSTARRIMRRIKKIIALSPERRKDDPHIRGQIAAMKGWTRHASHNLILPQIKAD
jgi:hypothetical protein